MAEKRSVVSTLGTSTSWIGYARRVPYNTTPLLHYPLMNYTFCNVLTLYTTRNTDKFSIECDRVSVVSTLIMNRSILVFIIDEMDIIV